MNTIDDNDAHLIVQLSDLHYASSPLKKKGVREPKAALSAVITHINTHLPAEKIVVATGDLVDKPTLYEYRQVIAELEGLQCPVYLIPGNHDDAGLMAEALEPSSPVKWLDEWRQDAWQLLFLDSSLPGKNEASGQLPRDHIDRLAATLDNCPINNIIIFIHHPPVVFGATWFRHIVLEGREAFNQLIDNYPAVRAVIFGHAHTAFHQIRQGKLYACAPSSWVQFDHSNNDRFSYLTLPPGYNWYKASVSGELTFGTQYIAN